MRCSKRRSFAVQQSRRERSALVELYPTTCLYCPYRLAPYGSANKQEQFLKEALPSCYSLALSSNRKKRSKLLLSIKILYFIIIPTLNIAV